MQEDGKMKCKICGEEKIYNYYKLGTNGTMLYKDGEGKLWKGKVCCKCQAKKRTEQRNKAALASKEEKGI